MSAALPQTRDRRDRQRRGQDVADAGAGPLLVAAGAARADVQGRARLPRSDLPGPGLRPDLLQPRRLDDLAASTCSELFARATADADMAMVEGVMGLFDGASPSALEGSTAEIAPWLDAPVLLVANAHGAARSLAATVKGFAEFEPGVRMAGVIANQGGSPRHREWLAESLAGAATAAAGGHGSRAARCPRCPAATWAW